MGRPKGSLGAPVKRIKSPIEMPFKHVKTQLIKLMDNINLPANRQSVMHLLYMWWLMVEYNDIEREKFLKGVILGYLFNKRGQIQWSDEGDNNSTDIVSDRNKTSMESTDMVRGMLESILQRGEENASNIQSAGRGSTEVSKDLDV